MSCSFWLRRKLASKKTVKPVEIGVKAEDKNADEGTGRKSKSRNKDK